MPEAAAGHDPGALGETGAPTETDADETGTTDPDEDGDGYPASMDCNDANATTFPGAAETCDGADQDCDGLVDEDAIDEPVWYADADEDGYGDPSTPLGACTAPVGFVAVGSDCNDLAAAVNPGAVEACNLVDDDCDGTVDDNPADAPTYYPDADGDRYGDESAPTTSCSLPAGHVVDGTDCYDRNASVYPGASTWLTTDRGDGSFDADCDGMETQEYTHVSTTGLWGSCCWDPGWVSSPAPACGVTANVVDASGNQPLRTQACQ